MNQILAGDMKSLSEYYPKMCFASCWSSPEALVKHLRAFDKSKKWHGGGFDDDTPGWAGVRTIEEAYHLAETGWKEGVPDVIKIRDTVNALNPVAPKAVKYGIAGSICNVPRAIAGDIKNMKQMDSAISKRKPVITLLSDMAANCGTRGEEITNRAAVVAAVVDQIEARGFAVEVIAVATTRSAGKNVVTAVKVKNAGQPVDIGRLAYGVGHVSMFRKLIFASWTSRQECQFLGGGLGSTYTMDLKDLEGKGAYYVPSPEGTSVFESKESACSEGLNYIINSLIDQQCPPFKDMKKKEIKEPERKPRWSLPDW